MKVYPVHGIASGNEGKRWFFDFYEQWSGFFPPRNWVDFTFIHFAAEYSPYKGSCDVELALLGFQIRVTYVYDTAPPGGN